MAFAGLLHAETHAAHGWHLFGDFLLHALKDTAVLLPWILILYIVIELLQNKADLKKISRYNGRFGPLLGSATGLIPQCGFSVMAAKLFEQKYITVGTLLAIFFATSDEAFVIMLTNGSGAKWVLPMLACKVGIGIAVGYGVDLLLRAIGRRQVRVEMAEAYAEAPSTTHEIFMRSYLSERDVEVNCSCGRQHDGDSAWKNYVLYPLLHTLKVAFFIFLVNLVLTAIVHMVGEDTFANFMHKNRFLQPFVSCLIGLIPNCASSVVITEAFLGGAITFGSCVAGLCVNAGLGFVVLLKNTRRWKRNLCLILFSYAVSVCIGMVLNLFPIMA